MKNATSKEIDEEISSQLYGKDCFELRDLLTIVKRQYKAGADKLEMRDMYSLFDKNRNGKLEQQEFKRVLKE